MSDPQRLTLAQIHALGINHVYVDGVEVRHVVECVVGNNGEALAYETPKEIQRDIVGLRYLAMRRYIGKVRIQT